MTAGDLSLGEYRKAKLDILAGIEANLQLIVANTGHADVHLTTEAVEAAWEAQGQRIDADLVIETIRSLGIDVD